MLRLLKDFPEVVVILFGCVNRIFRGIHLFLGRLAWLTDSIPMFEYQDLCYEVRFFYTTRRYQL